MKIPKINISGKPDLGKLLDIHQWHLERLNPWLLIATGAALLFLVAVLLFAGGNPRQGNEANLNRAKQPMGQVSELIQNIRRVLEDEQVQELTAMAIADPDKLSNLQQYVSGRIPDLIELKLFEAGLDKLRPADLDPFGYAVLDLLLTAQEHGLGPAQIHGQGEQAYLAMAVRVGSEVSPVAYLMVRMNPDILISTFKTSVITVILGLSA